MYVLIYDADELFLAFLGDFASGAEIAITNPNAAYMRLGSKIGNYDLNNEFRIYDVDPVSGGSSGGGAVSDGYSCAEADARFAPKDHTHDGYAAANHTHANDHTHSNKAVLDGITAEKVAAWDAGTGSGSGDGSGYVHPSTHPASMITGLATVATSGRYADLEGTPEIPVIPDSLPANGGNADTVGGKYASEFATSGHTHSGYAAATHSHTEYAASGHTHTASAIGAAASSHTHTPASIGAAAASHTHDYAASNHTHSGYASTSHGHANYASSTHSHTASDVGALPSSGGTVSGDFTVMGTVVANGVLNTQTIMPKDAGSYSIGSSDKRYYSTYLKVSPNVSSDERLKRDIAALDAASLAEFVRKLAVVSYNYTEDAAGEAKKIGVIAQDVISADAEIARFFVEQDEKGFFSLRPADLVFPLIAAVQQLSAEVAELKGQKPFTFLHSERKGLFSMKNAICITAGMVGSAIASAFGGWTASLTTLCIFMGLDLLSGWILAGVFHHSPKSATGALDSKANFKGLVRKGMILALVLVGHRLDVTIGTNYITDAVCISFIVNELLSLAENAGLMGLPLPAVITNAVDLLKQKAETKD